MARISLVLVAISLTGCAFDAGDWFSTLDARFEARFEMPESRDAGDGWQTLDSDYELRLERATIEVGNVELLASADAAPGGGAFNPANPPAGYSLCHNGHCHDTSGGLVTYEEIEASLGSAAASARVAVSLPVGDVDLLDDATRALDCVIGCGLPRVHLVRARTAIRSVTFEGRVRDGRSETRIADEVAWRWDERLDVVDQPALDVPIDVAVERDAPPETTLLLTLVASSRLFDGVDWSAVPEVQGVRDIATAGGHDATDRLLDALAEIALEAER